MSTAAPTENTMHELATRVSGDLEITLFTHTHDNTTAIELRHAAIKEPISFRVPPDRALDAFHHPFAYLERHLWRDRG